MAIGTNKPQGIEVDLQFFANRVDLAKGTMGRFIIMNSEAVDKALRQNLDRIAEKYGYQKKDWTPLALALAFAHERSLNLFCKQRAGRKKKWEGMLQLFLNFDVAAYIKLNPTHGLNSACKALSKEEFWANLKLDESTIRQSYIQYLQNYEEPEGNEFSDEELTEMLSRKEVHDIKWRTELQKAGKLLLGRGLKRPSKIELEKILSQYKGRFQKKICREI